MEENLTDIWRTLAGAIDRLHEYALQGKITELQGFQSRDSFTPQGNRMMKGVRFRWRDKIVDAHGFGIVQAVFDLDVGLELAAEYKQTGHRGKCR